MITYFRLTFVFLASFQLGYYMVKYTTINYFLHCFLDLLEICLYSISPTLQRWYMKQKDVHVVDT